MNHSGPIAGQRDNLKVIQCRECGFHHLDPIPDNSSLYSNGTFYTDLKPDYGKDYLEDREWWWAVYGDWLALVEDIAPNKFLLDVGAGTGDFLARVLNNKEWQADGIEPDYSMAQKHHFFHGGYRDYANKSGVGVISAHWVMEHLENPKDFLEWARGTLAHKGVLLVTIPNDFSEIQKRGMVAVNKLYYWLHPTHINYWNSVTFSEFLKRNGFDVQVSRTYGSWEPEKHLLAGQNYLEDHALGRYLHKARKTNELAMGAKHRMRVMRTNGLMGWGRDLTFVAVKR